MPNSGSISAELAERLAQIQQTYHQFPQAARTECELIIQLAREQHATLLQIYAAELYGKIMDHAGHTLAARNLLYEALQQAQAIHNFALEAMVCEQIARSYYTTGEYPQALQNWLQCLELSGLDTADAATWMLAKVGIGQVYDAQGEQQTALKFHQAALARIPEVDDPYLHAKILINIGVVELKLGALQAAKAALQLAQDICLQQQYADYAATTYSRLAEIALKEDQLPEAMTLLTHALRYARQVNYQWGQANILNNMAQIHTRCGEYQHALECIFTAQKIAREHQFPPVLVRLHQAAAHNAELAGQYELAISEIKACMQLQQQGEANNEQYRNSIKKTELRASSSSKLLRLMNHPDLVRGDSQNFWPLIASESAAILQVDQLTIWQLSADQSQLDCLASFPAKRTAPPLRLMREQMPVFFASLQQRQPIIAHDAAHHHFAWDLAQAYLQAQQIHSLMAFTVQHNHTVYLLLFEHSGEQRNWLPEEIQLANQLTHVIARALNNQARHQYQHEIHLLNARLSQSHQELEQRVQERTEGLLRTNQELQLTMHQLVQSEKLAALGRLVTGFAQELMPPLISALQSSHVLERQTEEIAAQLASSTLKRSSLQVFLQQTQSQAEFIEQKIAATSELVAQFKLVAVDTSSERRRVFNLHQTVSNLLEVFGSQVRHSQHQIVLKIPSEIELDSYPGPFEQVLSQLIQNALTHGLAQRSAGQICLSAELHAQHVMIRCYDDGVGIASDSFPLLTEPFYRPEADQQHRGLGLYIANNILSEVLGGKLELKSVYGQYTEVYFSIPLIAPHHIKKQATQ